jgi:hypothetical protein
MMKMKSGYVRLIKNCIFKSKLSSFLDKSYKRLLERAYDKIKENNWIIEERKEALESIIIKTKLKNAFKTLKINKIKQDSLLKVI